MKNVCFYCPEDIFQPGGGSTVAANVLKNFSNGGTNYIVFSRRTNIPFELSSKYNVKRIWYPNSPILRVLFDLLIAPVILLKHKNHKVVCLNSIVPLLYPFHLEVFFQMRMFHYEELDTFSKKIKNILGVLSLKKAKKVFVASEDHKRDLIKHLFLDETKIKVAYLGFDPKYDKEQLVTNDKMKKNCYWLFISIFRPYKNLEQLIEAYALLNRRYKNIPDLLIIGDYPKNYEGIEAYREKIKSIIASNMLSDKIMFLGLKPHKETMQYLANASLFIFPSKFEGFGLPILEAMALGVPVLSSDVHSLPEVGGDTIMYFKPHIPGDLYKKLDEIYLEGYKKNVSIAKDRSKMFTWGNTCNIIANET